MTGRRLVHVTTVPMTLTFLRGQVEYMRERGLDVRAISSPGDDLDRFADEYDIPISGIEMPRRITPLGDLGAVGRMAVLLRKIRPAIVHAHTPKGGLLGMMAATLAGVPIRIYHMRGLPMMSEGRLRRGLLRRTERLACGLAHRVLCVSHSLRGVAIEEDLCSPEKIKVLGRGSGQGVDAEGRFDPASLPSAARQETRERLEIPREARVVGFVGRLVRDKGVVELVEAWETLREEYLDLHMLLVGPFERQDPIPPDVERRLREDGRIRLVGMDWNTPPLYAAMDLLVLPTYREGFPNVPLEAASMELPVVATRIPGCTDAVEEDVTGTLVAPRDAEALSHGIRRYLDDPDLGRRHGRAGRERVLREFRPEFIHELLFREYGELMAAHGLEAPVVGEPPRSCGAV